MPIDQDQFTTMFSHGAWVGVKIFYILALSLNLLFTIIVVKQLSLMSKTILGPSEKWLNIASYFYLALAILCLILSFFSL